MRYCSLGAVALIVALLLHRFWNPPFSGLLVAMSAGLTALVYLPVLALASWRDPDTTLSQKHRILLSVLSVISSALCAFLFIGAFSAEHQGLSKYVRIGSVISFLTVLPLLIKRFDSPPYRNFLFSSIALYAASAF